MPTIHCANCSKPITVLPHAGHKRFCSGSCRQAWHGEQRSLAAELMRKLADRDPAPLAEAGLEAQVARVSGVELEQVKRVLATLRQLN